MRLKPFSIMADTAAQLIYVVAIYGLTLGLFWATR